MCAEIQRIQRVMGGGKASPGDWMSLHSCILTLLLMEVTLQTLGAGDLWVVGVPLLL